jgi:hypothetical protein
MKSLWISGEIKLTELLDTLSMQDMPRPDYQPVGQGQVHPRPPQPKELDLKSPRTSLVLGLFKCVLVSLSKPRLKSTL